MGRSQIARITVLAAERQRQALQMRLASATLSAIARALGYADESGARKAIVRALEDSHRQSEQDGARLRTLYLERLATYRQRVWPQLLPRPVLRSDGMPQLDAQGRPVQEPPESDEVRRAVRVLLRVDESERRLLGVDLQVQTPGGDRPAALTPPARPVQVVIVKVGGVEYHFRR